MGKPIAEIPPNPPFAKGRPGGFLGALFSRLNSYHFRIRINHKDFLPFTYRYPSLPMQTAFH